MSLIAELKRRNVVKVGILYVITGWLILQAADVLFALLGLPDWTLKLVLGILLLGFPVTLVFSWVFEITPEGIKREKDIDRTQSITPETGRKINLAIMVGLAVAIGLMLYQQFAPRPAVVPAPEPIAEQEAEPAPPTEAETGPSVAVLPFVNMSSDKEQDYFADGLSDTLMHVLSQVRGLKVAARTSSFAFKGKNMNVGQIATELGVAHILEGSVQKSGDKLRVIAQLIDASDGSHIWSANFDRGLEDIFAIQDEIAQEVVEALRVTLMSEDQQRLAERYQPTLEAYEQLILGRQQMATRTVVGLAAAEEHFQRAIELDPNYSLAYVGLADTYALQVAYSGRIFEEALALQQPLVDKALELDPLSGEAYTSRATIHQSKEDWEAAEADFLRAIELSPNYPTAYHWYNILLENRGRFEEGLTQIRIAAELDPLSPIIQHNVAESMFYLGRVEEGMAIARRNIERNPDFPNSYGLMSQFHAALGNIAEGQVWLEEAMSRNPGNPGSMLNTCFALLHLGDLISAESCRNELAEEFPGTFFDMWGGVVVHMYKQELDVGIGKLEAILERTPGSQFPSQILADLLGYRGELDRARQIMVETHPELLVEKLDLKATQLNPAMILAAVFHGLGESEARDVLLDAIEAKIATMHRTRGVGYGTMDVFVHHMRGDREKALAGLREAIDVGWRQWWWTLRSDWKLGDLTLDPEFQALIAEIEADMVEQRQWYEENKSKPLL